MEREEKLDAEMRARGFYSHLIEFVNADGRPRMIKCHARHVEVHMKPLREYEANGQCSNLRVTEI